MIRLNAKNNIGIYNVSYHYISMNVSVCPHCDCILLQGPMVSLYIPLCLLPKGILLDVAFT